MLTYSVIKKSQLEGARRLDAEYYQPEYLQIKTLVSKENLNTKPLRDLISRQVVTGSTPKIREPKGDGTDIYFIKTDTVREGQIVFEEADHLPIKQNIQNSTPKGGDILVTIIGATFDIVGRSAMVFPHYPKMNINQNVALIRPSEQILSGYLEAFLRGKYGRDQLWQQSRQTEQVNLNCREIENILVPVPMFGFQKEIEKLVQQSHELIGQSITIYNTAEKLLLGELGLGDFKADEDLFSVVNFSDIKSASRMDAEYFQPKYEKIISVSRAHGGKTLGELVTIKKGFEPGADAYEDEGKLFIRVSSISKQELLEKDQKYISRKLYDELKKEYEPKKGEILLTKDASPGVAYALDIAIDGIISSGILRLKLKEEINPDYLALCINSVVGQMQVERDAGGSVIAHWKPEQVKSMLIPILPKAIQDKVAGLVRESHATRKKAKELLEEAKRKVEELIESKSV